MESCKIYAAKLRVAKLRMVWQQVSELIDCLPCLFYLVAFTLSLSVISVVVISIKWSFGEKLMLFILIFLLKSTLKTYLLLFLRFV